MAQDPKAKSELMHMLDYFGCGFLSRTDLEWLDKWDPPEWLYARPDLEALAQLQAAIDQRYSHPLSAWRHLLDKDDSNQICWDEFREACDELNFTGNIPGAYRALDEDGSGRITMNEYHPESAALLESFKDWAEINYGSVQLAFQSIDADGGGSLTWQELKRACTRNRWDGDVRLLFECLDGDNKRDKRGKRSISATEISFLDSWEEPSEDEEEEVKKAPEGKRMVLPGLNKSESAPSLPIPKAKKSPQKEDSGLGRRDMNAWVHRFTAPKGRGGVELHPEHPATREDPYWADPMRNTNFQRWKSTISGGS